MPIKKLREPNKNLAIKSRYQRALVLQYNIIKNMFVKHLNESRN